VKRHDVRMNTAAAIGAAQLPSSSKQSHPTETSKNTAPNSNSGSQILESPPSNPQVQVMNQYEEESG
jgi:hypothetical protein